MIQRIFSKSHFITTGTLCLTSIISAQSLRITEQTIASGNLILRWEGGNPPFTVRRSSNLNSWTPLAKGLMTRVYTAPYSMNARQDFFQIRSAPFTPKTTGEVTVIHTPATDFSNIDQVFILNGIFPATPTAATRLTVSLSDQSPPPRDDRDLIVHWDDAPTDPADSIAFDNSITFTTNGTLKKFYLREENSNGNLILSPTNNVATGT